uniref:Odorant receptor n=1 Tax=Meteorus pulchricornis TaxID=51522 RepID=A0A1S5VFQ8_9HYME|nr:olfactory receptor 83 [Meteorus pulchricornis]
MKHAMSCENIDFFNHLNWRFTKHLLSCFGAWPFQTLRLRRVIRSVVFILVSSLFIPEILRIITVRKNANLLVECVPIFVFHFLTVTKMLQCLLNLKKIEQLLIQIRRDWESSLSSIEAEILNSNGQQNRILIHTYVYFIYSVTVVYMSTPMVPKLFDFIIPLNESRPKVNLYETEYYVDSETYELPILLHSYIITPFPTTIILAFDTLYVSCVHHGSIMFAIVGFLCFRHRLQNLSGQKNEQNTWENGKTDGTIRNYHSLANCIAKHKEVIEYAELLESTYTTSMIAIVGMNTLAISITGLQTILKINEPSEMIRFGTYTVGQVVHLFFLSWPSQKLIDESERIFQSTYQGEWYALPPKLRSCYVLIMMRGGKPCALTAGRYYTMSLQSFSQVVKTAVSYCTVLLSLQ